MGTHAGAAKVQEIKCFTMKLLSVGLTFNAKAFRLREMVTTGGMNMNKQLPLKRIDVFALHPAGLTVSCSWNIRNVNLLRR